MKLATLHQPNRIRTSHGVCRYMLLALSFVAALSLLPKAMAFPVSSPVATCPSMPPGPGFHYNGVTYVLTPHAYGATPNLPEKITAEYGASAHLVDWQTLKIILADGANIERFIAEVGIPVQNGGGACSNVFVSNGGSMQLDGRITLFARHDGHEGLRFKTFDTIGNHILDLGRWTWRSQALIAIPDGREQSAETAFRTSRFSNPTFMSFICLFSALALSVTTSLKMRRPNPVAAA